MAEPPNGLTPFTRETARLAGLRSAEARRARKLAGVEQVEQVAGNLRTLVTLYRRDELGPMALAAAADLIGRLVQGSIPVRNGGEAAELLRALVDVGRLESGDPTRTVAVAHMTGPALVARLRELQASSAADTVADEPEPSEPVPPA